MTENTIIIGMSRNEETNGCEDSPSSSSSHLITYDEPPKNTEGINLNQLKSYENNKQFEINFNHLNETMFSFFTLRVLFFPDTNIPYGYFSPIDIRDLIVANLLQADNIEYMELTQALLLENSYILGEDILIITWLNKDMRIKFSSITEKRFFPGNKKWSHWKQFYPDYELLLFSTKSPSSSSSSSFMRNSSPSSDDNYMIHQFQQRLLIHPNTLQPYTSTEMKDMIVYLKEEYKIRDFRNESLLKDFIRFLLKTFLQEIKTRLTMIKGNSTTSSPSPTTNTYSHSNEQFSHCNESHSITS